MIRIPCSLWAVAIGILLMAPAAADAQPFIQSAVPSTNNQTLTIKGVNFGATPPTVVLNFQVLAVQSSSPTQIVATLPTPALAAGSYPLIVVVGAQIVVSEVAIGAVGPMAAPALGTADAIQGFASAPISQTASTFNGATQAVERQTFRWVVNPLGNNTTNPSGRLDLLFGAGNANPAPTGLGVSQDGTIQFAPGQAFPIPASTVTSAMLADGTVAVADLAFDPATQTELNAHKNSADHDGRYYTMTQANDLFAPVWTKILTTSAIPLVPTTSFQGGILSGTFTKVRGASDIFLTWNGTVSKDDFPFASNFCEFQVRIDGNHDGSAGGGAGRVYKSLDGLQSVNVTALFSGLSTGLHTVSIWMRGDAQLCWVNQTGRPETIIIEESGI